MLTKYVYSQKKSVTEVPLQLFLNIMSDIYKHAYMRAGKTVNQRCLA